MGGPLHGGPEHCRGEGGTFYACWNTYKCGDGFDREYLGLLLRRGSSAIQTIIFQSVGLATLVLGVQMALEGENFLVLIFSLIIGGLWGAFAFRCVGGEPGNDAEG